MAELETVYGEKWGWVCRKTGLRKWFLSENADQFFYIYQNRNLHIETKEKLLEYCSKETKVVVYGAGNVGKLVVRFLRQGNIDIYGIAVESKEGNLEEIESISVREIDFYESVKENTVILVAVLADSEKIVGNLYDKGYRKVIRVAELFWER